MFVFWFLGIKFELLLRFWDGKMLFPFVKLTDIHQQCVFICFFFGRENKRNSRIELAYWRFKSLQRFCKEKHFIFRTFASLFWNFQSIGRQHWNSNRKQERIAKKITTNPIQRLKNSLCTYTIVSALPVTKSINIRKQPVK